MKYKKLTSKILLTTLCTSNIAIHPLISDANTSIKNFVKSSIVDTWETKSPISNTKYGVTSAVVDGKIYAIGGLNNSYFNEVEVYDPTTNTWESRANMPTARHCLTSAVVGGKIYCIGGYKDNKNLNVVEVYDPITDRWETKASMPTTRHHLTSAVINGKIYCIGGSDGSYLNTVEVYDPTTDTWETKTPMPTARYGLTSGVVDGKIYVIGGGNGNYLNTVEVYDPATDTWESKSSMPTGRRDISGGVVDGKIYCIGGYNNSVLDKLEVYDPVTDTWETKTSMLTPGRHTTSVVLDGKIYTIAGIGTSGNSNKVEVYTAISEERVIEIKVEDAIKKAEQTRDPQDIEDAKDLVNQLPESDKKNELLSRLRKLTSKSTTSNIDVYIKPESVLSLSLNTNSVTFEEFGGVEDMEIQNAITLTVESTLPYEVNSSLEAEIQSSDGEEIVDKSLLSIKANEKSNYNTFVTTKAPITLLDVQDVSKVNNHGIDLKLNSNILSKADVYKTTIKFEVKQK